MLVLGAKGQTATSPPAGLTPGGLRRECTCGRRIEALGGGLLLTGGPATLGGRKGTSVFSLAMGASILEMTTCWSCCAVMVLRFWAVPTWELKALPEEVFTLWPTGLFPWPAPNEEVPRILPEGPIIEGLGEGCELCILMGCWTGLLTKPNNNGILWAGLSAADCWLLLCVRALLTAVFKGVAPYKWVGVLRGVQPPRDVWELAWANDAGLSGARAPSAVLSCSPSFAVSLVAVVLDSPSSGPQRLACVSVSRVSVPAFFPFPLFRLQETIAKTSSLSILLVNTPRPHALS